MNGLFQIGATGRGPEMCLRGQERLGIKTGNMYHARGFTLKSKLNKEARPAEQ